MYIYMYIHICMYIYPAAADLLSMVCFFAPQVLDG